MSMMSNGLVDGNDGWRRRSASSDTSSQPVSSSTLQHPDMLITTEIGTDNIDSPSVMPGMWILGQGLGKLLHDRRRRTA
jgi:hypothetical protein